MSKSLQLFIFGMTISMLSNSQSNKQLIRHLTATYPVKQNIIFGQFYFDPKEKPERYIDTTLSERLPNLKFYTCDLLSKGCWSRQYYKCIIAYNTVTDSSIIFPPLWYSGVDSSFCKLFLYTKGGAKPILDNYLSSICRLLASTSPEMKFESPMFSNGSTTYILTQTFNKKKRNWRSVEFNFNSNFQLTEIKEVNFVSQSTTSTSPATRQPTGVFR